MSQNFTDPLEDYKANEAAIALQKSVKRILSSKAFISEFTPDLWLIKDILPSEEFGEMFGASGSRKTFIALDMAVCIHNGIPWQGRDVEKGNVLYVCGEAINGVRKRLSAFERHYNVEESMHILPMSIDMMREDSLQKLAQDIEDNNGNYSLIIIDTLNANFTGSEDSAEDFAVMKQNLQKHLGADSRLTMWIHHTGNQENKRGRGSSARFAGIDVSLRVTKNEEFSTLSNTKQKDAEAFEDLAFSFESVDTGFCEDDGTPLFSLCPKLDGDGKKKAAPETSKYHDEICKGIRLAIKDNKTVKPTKEFEEMFNLRPDENRCVDLKTAREYAFKMFASKNQYTVFTRWLDQAKSTNMVYFYDGFLILSDDAKLTGLTK